MGPIHPPRGATHKNVLFGKVHYYKRISKNVNLYRLYSNNYGRWRLGNAEIIIREEDIEEIKK